MASSGNICTLNPNNNFLSGDSGTSKVLLKSGNLETEDQGSYYSNFVGTHAVSGTGKFYYEVRFVTVANNGNRFGWLDLSTGVTNVAEASGQYPGSISASWSSNYNSPNSKTIFYNNNSASSVEYTGGATAGDIFCCGLDLSTGDWFISKNAALDPDNASSTSASTGTIKVFSNLDGGLYAPSGGEQAGSDCFYNFGQDSTFGGAATAGTGTDANGFGNFSNVSE